MHGIKQLLFKSDTGNFHTSWCQGFYFHKKLEYGIWQEKGGPCGIIATVQAFFLKHLLFVQKQKLTGLSLQLKNNCIASAIADILLNAASGNPSGAVNLVVPRGAQGLRANPTPCQPSACQKLTFNSGPDQRRRLLGTLLSSIGSFTEETGAGVVCLVYSVILTKGVEEMRADFDFEVSLINEYGYASQELINTMLVGKSASNCFDGDKVMGPDLTLKGIERQSEIGFLTLFEHYGNFEVGDYLKRPVLPIWVICSESHYSIMFSTNFALAGQMVTPGSRPFDVIYYDELAKQEEDIILTVEPGKYVAGGKRGLDGRTQQEYTVPIDAVLRTKWAKANINWNGRTVIL